MGKTAALVTMDGKPVKPVRPAPKMAVHILSTDTPIEDFENLFTSLEYAMEALIGLRERVIEAEDIKLADDAGSIMSLYIEYTKQLIAKGRDLTKAHKQGAA